MERRVSGNAHARCEGGEKPETQDTVGLPIPIGRNAPVRGPDRVHPL